MTGVRAIIVAAGRGRRLDPYTRTRPKPLLYVAGRPILAHLLDALPTIGISDVVVVVGYLGEQIATYLRGRPDPPAKIVVQEHLLGNGHAVHEARAHLEGPVLVLFGDTILVSDLGAAIRGPIAAIGITEIEDGRSYGIVELDRASRVRRLWEKPAEPPSRLAVAGAFFFPDARPLRTALDELVAGAAAMSRGGEFWFVDAIQRMIDSGHLVGTFLVDRFYDCGTAERLLSANHDLLEASGTSFHAAGNVACESSPRLNSVITDPCAIAPDATLTDARVGPFVTVAPGARIVRSTVRDAVVLPGALIEDATVQHAIIDRDMGAAAPAQSHESLPDRACPGHE